MCIRDSAGDGGCRGDGRARKLKLKPWKCNKPNLNSRSCKLGLGFSRCRVPPALQPGGGGARRQGH
eukprot:1041705-Alexandrium_andersonii.AAC.1